MDAGTVTGSGTIQTVGGNGYGGYYGGGAGGGGRIALYYTNNNFSGTTLAYGGHRGTGSAYNGGSGTIYQLDRSDNSKYVEISGNASHVGTIPSSSIADIATIDPDGLTVGVNSSVSFSGATTLDFAAMTVAGTISGVPNFLFPATLPVMERSKEI